MYQCITCLEWKQSICCSKSSLSILPSHQRINIRGCKLGLFGTESKTLCSSSASILSSMAQIIAKTFKEQYIFLIYDTSNAGSFPILSKFTAVCILDIDWEVNSKNHSRVELTAELVRRAHRLPFDRGTPSGVSFFCPRHLHPLLLRPRCWPQATSQSPLQSRRPLQNLPPLRLAAPSAELKDLHLHALCG